MIIDLTGKQILHILGASFCGVGVIYGLLWFWAIAGGVN